MRFTTSCLLLVLAGCGSVEYGRSERRTEAVVVTERSTEAAPTVVVAPEAGQPRIQVAAGAPAGQVIRCSGRERIRLSDMRLDGGDGPAIYASGRCRVDISESIITGSPAIYATDRARLRFRGCRIRGQLITEGRARVATPGSRVEM